MANYNGTVKSRKGREQTQPCDVKQLLERDKRGSNDGRVPHTASLVEYIGGQDEVSAKLATLEKIFTR